MVASPRIVAHLIVGGRPEPYLSAVLESISGVCAAVIVNDNSGMTPGPNADAFQAFANSSGRRVIVTHSTFTGFADARNACFDATPPELQNGWVLFVDADEVHGTELVAMARLLPSLPADVDAIDGYSRHFVGSFSWWRSVERRLCLFRHDARRRWRGVVHEQLNPVGRRVVLPYVWAHYGHVVTPRMEWEKSRLYSSLGQPGFAPTDDDLATVNAACAWGDMRAEVMPYRGQHPPAAASTIAELSQMWAATFAQVDAVFSECNIMQRVRRGMRSANYARLLAFRRLAASVQWQ